MSDAYRELPGAKTLDERAATIPGHVERIMLRDYTSVNEGFHILYDAAELLRRYADRIEKMEEDRLSALRQPRADEETVERVARAICEGLAKSEDHEPCECGPTGGTCVAMALFETQARDAIKAMAP